MTKHWLWHFILKSFKYSSQRACMPKVLCFFNSFLDVNNISDGSRSLARWPSLHDNPLLAKSMLFLWVILWFSEWYAPLVGVGGFLTLFGLWEPIKSSFLVELTTLQAIVKMVKTKEGAEPLIRARFLQFLLSVLLPEWQVRQSEQHVNWSSNNRDSWIYFGAYFITISMAGCDMSILMYQRY